jgi:hypothetical protein
MINYYENIVRMVETNQGLKAVDLSLKVMSEINPTKFEPMIFYDNLKNLVVAGEIIEVEYKLPPIECLGLDRRTKSMYFPKGTSFEFGRKNG